MNGFKLAFGQLPKNNGLTAVAALTLALLFASQAFAELAVQRVEIAPRALQSRVPETTAQGRFLAPQAISAVDVSADGQFITVGTMAFSHDANVWQFNPDGAVIAKRYFPPWAPMQVATLPGGGRWRWAWLIRGLLRRTPRYGLVQVKNCSAPH